MKFLVVAIDYFTKWTKVEPVACIAGRQVIKFLWKNILTRFGTPRVLIRDNGPLFTKNPFRSWCTDKGIEQRFTSAAHP